MVFVQRLVFQTLSAFTILLVIVAGPVYAENKPVILTIAYEDKEQFPYYLGDTSDVLEMPGVAVEMVQQLEAMVPGIKIELRRYPWKRCLTLLQYGSVDAIFNASFNLERAKFGVYPLKLDSTPDGAKRLTTISYSWYAPFGTNISEIETQLHPIAAPAGYSIVKQLVAEGYDVNEPAHSQQALKMVAVNRVKAAALQTVTGDALLRETPELRGIVRLEPPIVSKPYYLVFSKRFTERHPKLVNEIWEALAVLRETRMPDLEQKYTSRAK